ncbi:uncharacterized protein SCDLUD_005267 [Saccharomycodes ludwigii]|uniref:uncharacterized protein n=1 Tax=Saccharomycodes ludwigii TaxID=36035 RepID=UPI001E82185B|nr:hypothetical protein SCDLUD_005267 [Saccharomycodes ludwigii]KAH3898922.1 hypothetical protein SCDLUD_005267 [Saccharomycodes ludwigii]
MIWKFIAYFSLALPTYCNIYVTNRQYKRINRNTVDNIRLPPRLNKYINKPESIKKNRFQLLLQLYEQLCFLILITLIFMIPNFLPWLWVRASKLRSYLDIVLRPSKKQLADSHNKYTDEADFINISNNVIFVSLSFTFCALLILFSAWIPKRILNHNYGDHHINTDDTASEEDKGNKLNKIIISVVMSVYGIINIFNRITDFETKQIQIKYLSIYASVALLLIGLLLLIIFSIISLIPIRSAKKLEEIDFNLYQDLMELCNNNNKYGFKNNIGDICIAEFSGKNIVQFKLRGLPFKNKKLYLNADMLENCCDVDGTKKNDQIYALVLSNLWARKYNQNTFFALFLFLLCEIWLVIFFGISYLVDKKYQSILSSFGFVFGNSMSRYSNDVIGMKHYPQSGILVYTLIIFYPIFRIFLVLFNCIFRKCSRKIVTAVVDQGYGRELYYGKMNMQFNDKNAASQSLNGSNDLLVDPDPWYVRYYFTKSVEPYLFLSDLIGLKPNEDEEEQELQVSSGNCDDMNEPIELLLL